MNIYTFYNEHLAPLLDTPYTILVDVFTGEDFDEAVLQKRKVTGEEIIEIIQFNMQPYAEAKVELWRDGGTAPKRWLPRGATKLDESMKELSPDGSIAIENTNIFYIEDGEPEENDDPQDTMRPAHQNPQLQPQPEVGLGAVANQLAGLFNDEGINGWKREANNLREERDYWRGKFETAEEKIKTTQDLLQQERMNGFQQTQANKQRFNINEFATKALDSKVGEQVVGKFLEWGDRFKPETQEALVSRMMQGDGGLGGVSDPEITGIVNFLSEGHEAAQHLKHLVKAIIADTHNGPAVIGLATNLLQKGQSDPSVFDTVFNLLQ